MEVEKILNVELFSFDGSDDIDGDVIQYYDVKWELESLKKYNGRIVTMNRNADIEIYSENEQTIDKAFNLSIIKEFRDKLK